MSETTRSGRLLREVFLAGFMSGLPADNIAWAARRLAGSMDDVRRGPGEVVYRQGELSSEHFFIVSGEVKLEAPGKPVWTLGERALVGTIDMTLERPRARTVTATRATHLLRVRADDWFDMLEDNFEMVRRAVQGLAMGVHALRVELGSLGDGEIVADRRPPAARRPLDLVERIVALRTVPLFAGADVQSLTTLGALAREVVLTPGEALSLNVASNDALVVVIDGKVLATRADRGAPREIAFGSGALVLGSAAASPQIPRYELRAAVASRALRIAHEDYFDVMEEHFALARSALKALVSERELLTDERGRRAEAAGAPLVTPSPIDNVRRAL
jgi:CRP-like cAMP-binding protein